MRCCRFSCLEQLSGLERFTHELLQISPNQEQNCYHTHEHPGEQEAESHAPETHRKRVTKLFSTVICLLMFDIHTYAISRFPPVLDTHPRVVGEVCRSNPRMPHNRPKKLKAKISTTIQQRAMQQIHLKTTEY